jgi:hypothetical protein
MEFTISTPFRIGQKRQLFRIMVKRFMKNEENEDGRRILQANLFKLI